MCCPDLRPSYWLLGCCLLAGGAGADDGRDLEVNGFYSVTALHTSKNDPLHRYAPYGDQDKPARQQKWDLRPDSKLGLMLALGVSPQWRAKAQLIYRDGSSREHKLKPRLAFVEYQPDFDWTIKLGRTVQGLLPGEESLYTDYAQLPVRAPQEPYAYLPNTEIDGIWLARQIPLGSWLLELRSSYGQRSYYSQQFYRKLRDSFGVAAMLQNPATTLHLAARQLRFGLHQADSLASATGLIRSVAEAQGRGDIARQYDERHIEARQLAAGIEHQAGALTLKADLLLLYSSAHFIARPIASGNLQLGYRSGDITPYLVWGEIRDYGRVDEDRLLPDSAAAIAATATANYLAAAISGEQRTRSFGLRWDAMRNTALKLQFDRIERKPGRQGWFVAPADSAQFAPDNENHTNVWSLSLQGMF